MGSKTRKTILYNVEFNDSMFHSETNKTRLLVSLSVLYLIILAIILTRHFAADNINTNVTKYSIPILISVITISWLIACVFLIQKKAILINEKGFTFKRIKKTINYSWADVKTVDTNKTKNGNYIVVEFNNGKIYGTGYIKELDNLIKKYLPKK